MSELAGTLICVTGPIGAGKSTLVTQLASALGADPYREQVDANPAYGKALEDPAGWAFESELGFVLESLQNWEHARRSGTTAVLERCVADNVAVFGGSRAEHGEISAHQLRLLQRCAALAPALGATPDLVVLLTCPAAVCLDRIRRRDVAGERRYTEPLLREIGERYERWAHVWTATPVVRVDSGTEDIRSRAFADGLAIELRGALERSHASGRRRRAGNAAVHDR